MKRVTLFFICCFFTVISYSQVTRKQLDSAKMKVFLTDDNWHKMTGYLNNEDWGEANKLATLLLTKCTAADSDNKYAALLRCMFIISDAGLLNEQRITQQEALNDVKRFVGQKIMLPGHPLSLKYGANVIQPLNNSTDTLFVTETNKKMTEIYCFEYITLAKKIPMEIFNKDINQFGLIEGIVSSVNVEGNMLPRYKIYLTNASMLVYSP